MKPCFAKCAPSESLDASQEPKKPKEESKPLTFRQDLWIAFTLFLIAFILRYHFMNAGLFYTDAVIAAQKAEQTLNAWMSGSLTVYYMHGVGYPGNVITIAIIYLIFKIFGAASAEFATFFSSMFFASLTAGLIYLFVKKIFDSAFAGFSAAMVLTVLPVYLSTSTFGMSHQLACFFILLSFYLAVLSSESKGVKLKMLASACFGWAAATRIESLLMLPLFFLFYWGKNPPVMVSTKEGYLKSRMTQSWGEIIQDIAYLALPLAIMILLPYASMLRSAGIAPITDASEYNKWLGFWDSEITPLVAEWIGISVTPIGWILLFTGLVSVMLRKDKYIPLVLIIWCAYFFVYANTMTVEDRHTMPALIAFTIAIGLGLDVIYNKIHKIAGILVLLLLVGWMLNNIYPLLEYRSAFCGPKELALKVKDLADRNSVVIAMDEGPHLEYYGKLKVINHPTDGDPGEINKSMTQISGYLENGTSVYIVSSGFNYDTFSNLSYDKNSNTIYDPQTNKIYSNLLFNPEYASITDSTSGVSFNFKGVWQAELIYNFKVLPLDKVKNEYWQKANVAYGNFTETIFRVSKRA